jgi:hypothetical protein
MKETRTHFAEMSTNSRLAFFLLPITMATITYKV